MMKRSADNFADVYKSYFNCLYHSCMLRVRDREIVKDIVQETFAKALRYLSLGGIIRNKKAFLYKTMRNMVVSYYRSKKPFSLDSLIENESFDPPALANKDIEQNAEGHRALDKLDMIPDKYREVVIMHFVKGLSFKEIAAITHEAENTVIVRFHRAIKKLRVILKSQNTQKGSKQR